MADALAVLAAFFFALAATLQQKGALATGRRLDGAAGFLDLAKQRWWLLGTLTLLAGYAGQAVALAGGQLALGRHCWSRPSSSHCPWGTGSPTSG